MVSMHEVCCINVFIMHNMEIISVRVDSFLIIPIYAIIITSFNFVEHLHFNFLPAQKHITDC